MPPSKPLSLAEIRRNLDRFAVDWADETRERGEAQSFWNDLFDCFGVRRRDVGLYERAARRFTTGHQGYIDLFVPNLLIAEHKSRGSMKDARADDQALDYLLGGDIAGDEKPRYLISCDFETMRLTDLEAPAGSQAVQFPVADLAEHVEKLAFIAGYTHVRTVSEHEEAASIRAANIMAALWAAFTEDSDTGYQHAEEEEESETEQAASVLLTRLLFLLFGDDAGLWEKDLLKRFITDRTSEDGSDLGAQLRVLFEVLDTPRDRRPRRIDPTLDAFPYVNGEIFSRDSTETLFFDRAMRDELLAATEFDWASISPAVFGSLFQAIKSRDARRAAGEHYTTESNILKTIGPLFLDDIKSKVDEAWNSAASLRRIHRSFASMRYLDPACGCGNFLIVAYREMRRLELDILVRLKELEGKLSWQQTLDDTEQLLVTLDQFHGIELNWWPAKIAETAMFLVDHQANREMAKRLGVAPKRLPIRISADIHHENALHADWHSVIAPGEESTVYIFGNPPFAGHKERTAEQSVDLRLAWKTDRVGHLDFVTAWYAKAIEYFGDSVQGRWAFVSTNSVALGEAVPQLFGPLTLAGWRIAFAHRTFRWTSEAPGKAQVHCVIVGFERQSTRSRRTRLFDYSSADSVPMETRPLTINAYLVDGPELLVTPRRSPLSPDLPEIVAGSTPIDWGGLTVEPADEAAVRDDPIAARYLRPYVGGRELINNITRWCLWLEDATPGDIAASPVLRSRVQAVRDARLDDKVTRAETRDLARTPHLFGERRQPKGPYLGLPQAFARSREYATAARLDQEVIASIKLFTAPDEDGFLFAIVSSSMFMVWQRTVGQRTPNNQYSLSASVVWNNLPLPPVGRETRQRVIAAGQTVLRARELRPGLSLADAYSPLSMDPALVRAHDALDAEVDKMFGARGRLRTERERQALLFAKFAELSSGLLAPTRRRR